MVLLRLASTARRWYTACTNQSRPQTQAQQEAQLAAIWYRSLERFVRFLISTPIFDTDFCGK